jgi:hypothetical protein
MKFRWLVVVVLVFVSLQTLAQKDTLVMKDGTVLDGEIKKMEKGVLTMETSFSDEDFKIEWKKIRKIVSSTFFLVSLSDGERVNGTINTIGDGKVVLVPADSADVPVKVNIKDVVFIRSVDRKFWDRINASIDVGFDLAKSNNLRQLSLRSNIGYTARRWGTDVSFNTMFSKQDDIDDIKRYDGAWNYKYFLKRKWYIPVSISFLSNTEQSIKLRTVGKLGGGLFLIQSNTIHWGVELGFSFNNETYFSDDPKRNSGESFVGTEFNIFDIKDLSMLVKLGLFADLTEKNHWRSDVSIDFKYDLPLDFYIKTAFTLNFDNKPVQETSRSDYVFHTGFGWSW